MLTVPAEPLPELTALTGPPTEPAASGATPSAAPVGVCPNVLPAAFTALLCSPATTNFTSSHQPMTPPRTRITRCTKSTDSVKERSGDHRRAPPRQDAKTV